MKSILRFFSILLIKYLQKKYKTISLKNRYNQSNQILAKLRLIQAILHYFKDQFHAWGYFHPHCTWSSKDEKYFKKLFPFKDFEELDLVVWYNPEAVIYYHNKIYRLSKGASIPYSKEIRSQLIKWKRWN